MNYTITKNDNGQHVADIKIDAKEWDTYLESAYLRTKDKYTVQGFRKGKAPRNVIEKMYGEHIFMQDALDDAYYKAYTQILSENADIKPISSPSLDIKSFDKDALELLLTIPCTPKFELAQYKGNVYHKHIHTVGEDEVAEAVNRELMRASKLEEKDGAVAMDDFVNLDFEGYIDGEAFEGGSAKDYQLKIGSHSFIDTFEDQLVGLKVGDEKDVNVTFPADYHEPKFSGKPAVFKVKINKIRARVMPELNDEFVKDISEYDTVADFKAGLKKDLEERNANQAKAHLENEILDDIVDRTAIDLPEALLENEKDRMMHGFEQQLAQQGIALDDYAKYIGKTIDEIKAEQSEYAVKSLKSRLVLEKLITEEKIDILDGQYEEKVKEIADSQHMAVADFEKEISEDLKNRILNNILMDNIVKFLIDNNTIEEEVCDGHHSH